jgi:hypothetical protein
LHRIGINAPIDRVYRALTTQEGISSWWTRKVKAVPEVGAAMEMRFKNDSLITRIRHPYVKWKVLAGPPEWIGTAISFALKSYGKETVVLFAHREMEGSSRTYASP